jgi:hypothetical protein
MKFVNLERYFVPLMKNQEPSLDIGRFWGPRVSGWLGWEELKRRRRVILLAEAASEPKSSGISAMFSGRRANRPFSCASRNCPTKERKQPSMPKARNCSRHGWLVPVRDGSF